MILDFIDAHFGDLAVGTPLLTESPPPSEPPSLADSLEYPFLPSPGIPSVHNIDTVLDRLLDLEIFLGERMNVGELAVTKRTDAVERTVTQQMDRLESAIMQRMERMEAALSPRREKRVWDHGEFWVGAACFIYTMIVIISFAVVLSGSSA